MIFALVDYLRYRFQRGQYAPQKLKKDGWFLADESSLTKLKAVGNGGTLFSLPVNSFTSWVVMYCQGGPPSHVAMLTKEGTVIEAITAGVVERPVSVYFDGKHYLQIWILPLDAEGGKRMLSFARSQIGCRYGSEQVVRLGLLILLGDHHHWRPQISFDVLIFLATAWLSAYKLPPLRWVILALGVVYGLIVFIFRLRPHPAHYDITITGRRPQWPFRR